MARKTFRVLVGEKDHFVEVNWSRWSNAGEIKVNGEVINAWGSGWWLPREVEFKVGNEKATLVRKGLIWENPKKTPKAVGYVPRGQVFCVACWTSRTRTK